VRPGYREVPPPPALGRSVACLWMRVVPGDGASPTRVLPDACVDLVWSPGTGAWIAGPDTGPVLVDAAPGSVIVGARFRPGAGGAALGLPLSEVRDERPAAADVDRSLDRALPPDIDPAGALRALLAVAGERAAAGPPDVAVGEAARLLADPRETVGGLAARLGLSERQLRRRCDAGVGYGPKTLQRTLRFRRLLEGLDRGDDLARIALDAGYADQAHMTRECTRLAGLPPAALRQERFPKSPEITHSCALLVTSQ
jgi:AraC-like DNA-binding protein